eukprot:COSAG05_NODE_29_length_29038_cov_1237.466985_22_plen_119_part_00
MSNRCPLCFPQVREPGVFGLIVELQLRAEEIEAQSQQLSLLRQRIVQLACNGRMQDVEAALVRLPTASAVSAVTNTTRKISVLGLCPPSPLSLWVSPRCLSLSLSLSLTVSARLSLCH